MNWPDDVVEKVALKIFDTYSASGVAADWAKDLNWHDVKRMSENSEAYAKVRDLCYKEAQESLSAITLQDIAKLPKISVLLLDVADYVHWRKVNPHIKGGENYLKRFKDSLTPFTEASNG